MPYYFANLETGSIDYAGDTAPYNFQISALVRVVEIDTPPTEKQTADIIAFLRVKHGAVGASPAVEEGVEVGNRQLALNIVARYVEKNSSVLGLAQQIGADVGVVNALSVGDYVSPLDTENFVVAARNAGLVG